MRTHNPVKLVKLVKLAASRANLPLSKKIDYQPWTVPPMGRSEASRGGPTPEGNGTGAPGLLETNRNPVHQALIVRSAATRPSARPRE